MAIFSTYNMLARSRSLVVDALRLSRGCLHSFFPAKWMKIYIDDAYHLGLLLRTLSIDHVIDVGAATGQFALSIRRNGYLHWITSIEPLQSSWDELCQCARRDRKWRVFDRSALGSSTQLMPINRAANNDSSSFLPVTAEQMKAAPRSAKILEEIVQVFTLDSVFDSLVSQSDTILLKLDVQGYEDQVIRGASESIKRIKAALIETSIVPMYEGQSAYLDVIEMMGRHGFEPFAFFKGFCNEETGQQLQLDVLFLNKNLA